MRGVDTQIQVTMTRDEMVLIYKAVSEYAQDSALEESERLVLQKLASEIQFVGALNGLWKVPTNIQQTVGGQGLSGRTVNVFGSPGGPIQVPEEVFFTRR